MRGTRFFTKSHFTVLVHINSSAKDDEFTQLTRIENKLINKKILKKTLPKIPRTHHYHTHISREIGRMEKEEGNK